ncbi:MAG: hypothetical protein AAF572_28760 [Cyanobacteria bacterium P01_B01_bin.77]
MSRLDRIEALLSDVTKITESNARAIAANADAIAAAKVERENIAADLMRDIDRVAKENDRRYEETQQQIQTLIEENREFRKQTERWITALQENVQTLIAEINRIWQRIA